MDKQPITEQGYNKLTQDFKHLKEVEKPRILRDVDSARQLGDLKENAEYHAAREEQKNCEAKIAELSDLLTKIQVVDPSTMPHSKVSFGSTVTIVDVDTDEEKTYTIVGAYESDADKGLISFHSPLAKQLLGKGEGDEFTAKLPSGNIDFEVIEVKYKEIQFS